MEKRRDIKGWVILAICLASLFATLISNWAIRGNDLKHLEEKVDDILTRVVRIENVYINKGESK